MPDPTRALYTSVWAGTPQQLAAGQGSAVRLQPQPCRLCHQLPAGLIQVLKKEEMCRAWRAADLSLRHACRASDTPSWSLQPGGGSSAGGGLTDPHGQAFGYRLPALPLFPECARFRAQPCMFPPHFLSGMPQAFPSDRWVLGGCTPRINPAPAPSSARLPPGRERRLRPCVRMGT